MPESIQRDLDREASKMLGDITNFQRHYGQWQGYHDRYVRQSVIEWAGLVIDHPKAVVMVVETTPILDEHGYAYSGEKEPIRITLRWLDRREDERLQDWLIAPTHSRQVGGTEYHGLTMDVLRDKPNFASVWPEIQSHLFGQHIIVFGAQWAREALRTMSNVYDPLPGATCLHTKCKRYYGQFYDLSLQTVLSYQGVNKTRTEMTDSRERIEMQVLVLRNLAEGKAKVQEVPDTPVASEAIDLVDELDAHPF